MRIKLISLLGAFLLCQALTGWADMEMPPDRRVNLDGYQMLIPDNFAILDNSNEDVYTISDRQDNIVIAISFLAELGGRSLPDMASYDAYFMEQDGYSLESIYPLDKDIFPQVSTVILLYSRELNSATTEYWESVLFYHQSGQLIMLGMSYVVEGGEWSRPELINTFMENFAPFPQGAVEHHHEGE
jgi:hypothetical protein